jgi:large subunit ribosomal protein L25
MLHSSYMEKINLEANLRTVSGGQVAALRRQDILPAVIYGHNFEPISIQIPNKEFERVYSEAGESTVVYLKVDGKDYPTLIKDAVRDALSDKFIHADFQKIRLDEKISAKIQLNFVGDSEAITGLGGILVKNMSEVEVEGFPQDLPHQIDVDLAGLKGFQDQILVKDLAISSKLEVKADADTIVALIQEPISEEELKAQLETPVAGTEEVEVIKKEKPEEEVGEETPAAVPAEPEKK